MPSVQPPIVRVLSCSLPPHSPMPSVPQKTQILVVGGGPSGSYAAAALALEGFDVVLLEMAKFPRYHIGESLLPSVRHYLRFIGAEDAVAAFGFARKPGAAVKFNQHMREGYTDFVALGAQNSSWNVVRAQFDQLLLQHAAACGVRVFDQTRVTEVRFAPSARNGKPNGARTADGSAREHGDRDAAPELGRPTAVAYETVRGGTGEIAFDYLVDASGRQGVMSTRYMMNRKFNAALRNVAVWGYWRGTGMYGRGTSRENAPWFEALSDESGWAWFIPLHDGLASVGVVMDQQLLAARTRTGDIPPAPPSLRTPATLPASPLAARYVGLLALAPGLLALLGAGELVGAHGEDGKAPPLARSTSDFSYAADAYAGEGFRVVGDAGGACVSARRSSTRSSRRGSISP
ncbi:hypothetical protein AcV7_000026 [Taiwanofungus camphoratus]|nr:hypothetical protein AcV7_000026 [Antrodia cinnamomea]